MRSTYRLLRTSSNDLVHFTVYAQFRVVGASKKRFRRISVETSMVAVSRSLGGFVRMPSAALLACARVLCHVVLFGRREILAACADVAVVFRVVGALVDIFASSLPSTSHDGLEALDASTRILTVTEIRANGVFVTVVLVLRIGAVVDGDTTLGILETVSLKFRVTFALEAALADVRPR